MAPMEGIKPPNIKGNIGRFRSKAILIKVPNTITTFTIEKDSHTKIKIFQKGQFITVLPFAIRATLADLYFFFRL